MNLKSYKHNMKNIKEPQCCMANAHRAAVYGGHSLQ